MARKNGYFQLVVKDDGTYIHFIPPEDDGDPIDTRELEDYLSLKRLFYDRIECVSQAKKNEDILYKLNTDVIRPVDEYMVFDISDDKMSVICRFYPPSQGGSLMTIDDIQKDFRYNQIKAKPDPEACQKFFDDRKYCTDYVLARGSLVKPGEDGYVEYLFDTDPVARPKTNADGSVDFHALNSVRACVAGQVLARVHKETPGVPGQDVFGELIMPISTTSTLGGFSAGFSAKTVSSSDILEQISCATLAISGTTTEFPNCLYACVSDTVILKVSGNPCKRAHSLGVSLLGFLPFWSISISDPSL